MNHTLTKWSLMQLLNAFLPFPERQILDSLKLSEFPDNNFSFDENGRKLSERVENTVGKE